VTTLRYLQSGKSDQRISLSYISEKLYINKGLQDKIRNTKNSKHRTTKDFAALLYETLDYYEAAFVCHPYIYTKC
jgi:hypothetical protein